MIALAGCSDFLSLTMGDIDSCVVALEAERRSAFGTGEAKRLRREKGLVPAVVYSRRDGMAPVVTGISVSALTLRREYDKKHIVGRVFNLKFADGKDGPVVVLYDFSMHSVTGAFQSVEFYEVSNKKNESMLARVSVVFTNHESCLPVKRGGFLNVLLRTLTIECKPADYVGKICVDLSNAGIGQTYRVSDLPLPKGYKVRRCNDNTLVARFMGKKVSAQAAAAEGADAPATAKAAAKK